MAKSTFFSYYGEPTFKDHVRKFLICNKFEMPATTIIVEGELPGSTKETRRRIVRAVVKSLREEGMPIVGTNKGYALARTPEALEAYRAKLIEEVAQRVRLLGKVQNWNKATAECAS